jgi:serine/threonine protein kinase
VDDLHWHDAAPNLSIQLAELLDRMMMRLPSQRPQRAEDILQQLAEIKNISSLPTVSSRPRQAVPPGKPQQSAQKTEYVPYSGSATETGPASFASPTVPITQSQVEPNFVSRCQQELAEFIGPIASVICKRTLNQNPNLSRAELIEALAQKIPDRQQAQKFRQRLGD